MVAIQSGREKGRKKIHCSDKNVVTVAIILSNKNVVFIGMFFMSILISRPRDKPTGSFIRE